MNRSKSAVFVLSLVLYFGASMPTQAGWWSNFWNWMSGKDPEYTSVIVTSNFVRPRLLAELMQNRTSQPIILLPTGEEQDKIFIMGQRENQNRAMKAADFGKALELLSPKNIIFLGNDQYAPGKYRDEARKLYPIIVIEHDDVDRVVDAASEMLDYPKLKKQYSEMISQIDTQGAVKPKPQSIWAMGEGEVVPVPAPSQGLIVRPGKK